MDEHCVTCGDDAVALYGDDGPYCLTHLRRAIQRGMRQPVFEMKDRDAMALVVADVEEYAKNRRFGTVRDGRRNVADVEQLFIEKATIVTRDGTRLDFDREDF
jgi:hypothetical protein